MVKSITRNLVAGIKKRLREIYSSLYILNDTCDTCTVNQYIKAVYEGRPRAILEKGFAFNKTINKALISLIEQYAQKAENTQTRKTNTVLKNIYRLRSNLDCLTMSLNKVIQGNADEVIRFLQSNLRIIKKKPTNKLEAEDLIKTIQSAIKSQQIKLNEEEEKHRRLSENSSKNDKSVREVFLDNLTAFKMGLGLTYNISLDITLSEYISYSKQYEQFIKRQIAKNGKK